MVNLRLLVLVVLLSILTMSCATPPGKMTEADFVSKEIVLNIPVSQAYRQLLEGLRFCGSSSGGLFIATVHGIPDCMPVEEDGSVLCDLYGEQPYGMGRSDWVVGRIELKPHSKGTTAILKVWKSVAKKDLALNAWEQFILGRAKEVCP